VARHARVTPLLRAIGLSEQLGRDVYLKAECLQYTGSFKVRGAAARLEALTEAERSAGVVATVYVPEWVDPVKLKGIEAAGAEARAMGATYDESEAAALIEAERTGRTYVSGYDDLWVITGQGTIAFEIAEALGERPAAVLAPLSGGGLLSGIAAAFRDGSAGSAERESDEASRPVQCVGVSASNAGVMLASVRAGQPVELPEQDTLANALAGGIDLNNRHSFKMILDLVDEHAEVSEAQIADAMRYALERLSLVVEGGGAVALAAVLGGVWTPPSDLRDGPIVVVLTGGNVATETLVEVLGG